jgi:hypothetical protein
MGAPHILLVFREMWDITALTLKLVADQTDPYGYRRSSRVPHVRISVARISHSAALATKRDAAFSQRKPHKSLEATNIDRKSGIRGPKTMGEALTNAFR